MQASDIIASFALLISILSLWSQRLSDRKQLMVGNFLEYTKRYQEIIAHFPKEVIDENFDLTSLADKDREELMRYMWMYFDLCYEEYYLHKLGYIDKNLWIIWESGMKSAFSRAAFRHSWQLIIGSTKYGSDLKFIKFVESMIQSPLRRK